MKILSKMFETILKDFCFFVQSSKMSAEDCYQLGEQAFLNNNNKIATQWFQEAMKRLPAEDRSLKFDILGYLTLSLYNEGKTNFNFFEHCILSEFHVGKLKEAIDTNQQVIEIAPFNDVARKNRKFFQEKLAEDEESAAQQIEDKEFV